MPEKLIPSLKATIPLCEIDAASTRMIPDQPATSRAQKEREFRLEVAKHGGFVCPQIFLNLETPLRSRCHQIRCTAWPLDFGLQSLTAHAGSLTADPACRRGVVYLFNLAEADGAQREKRRLRMREPYRTLLGHFTPRGRPLLQGPKLVGDGNALALWLS